MIGLGQCKRHIKNRIIKQLALAASNFFYSIVALTICHFFLTGLVRECIKDEASILLAHGEAVSFWTVALQEYSIFAKPVNGK